MGNFEEPPVPTVFEERLLKMTIHDLNDGWQFREVAKPAASPTTVLPWLPARVPGHVHLDLMAAGIIADPFSRMNEKGVAWIDESSWIYQRTIHLDAPIAPASYLQFDG